MRRIRPGQVALIAGAVIGIGAAGAAVNLRLLDSQRTTKAPITLGTEQPSPGGPGSSTGVTATTSPASSPSSSTPGSSAPGGVPGQAPSTAATAPPGSSIGPGTTAPRPPSPSSSAASTTARPATTATTAAPASRTYSIGQAGTVTLSVRNGQAVVDAVRPAAGWTYEQQVHGDGEVEVEFHSEGGGDARLRASVENGQLQVRIDSSGGSTDD